MPSAVVEIRTTYPPEIETQMLELVHQAIVRAFKVNPLHRNVTLVAHQPHRFLGRLDCPDSDKLTNVTIYLLPGRSLTAKRHLYQLLIRGLWKFGIPAPCILIRLHELPPENFGVRGGQPICDIDLGYPLNV